MQEDQLLSGSIADNICFFDPSFDQLRPVVDKVLSDETCSISTSYRAPRPRDRSAECGQQFPPSDGDCHTPLPREVRKRKDITPRACSLHVSMLEFVRHDC